MTQYPEAVELRADATFFPAVSELELDQWQSDHGLVWPAEWREFYLQSNGMEARKGEWLPILNLADVRILEAN